jgi:hypothetical protein
MSSDCFAARNTDYVGALGALESVHGVSHAETFGPRTPRSSTAPPRTAKTSTTPSKAGRHGGAVVVPAVLAACERFGRDGAAARFGIAIGIETLADSPWCARRRFTTPAFIPRACSERSPPRQAWAQRWAHRRLRSSTRSASPAA